MAYVKSTPITSSEFNTFAGVTATAASSSSAATGVAGYLWGVGYGDRGYGQSTPSLTSKSVSEVETGADWSNLRTTIANLASWQNTSTALLPPSTAIASSAPIIAHNSAAPSSNAYSLPDLLTLLDTNRFNYQIGNMTVTANDTSSTRLSAWGSSNSGITCEFSVTFASENAARYFFNTGGELRIALAHPDGSSPRNLMWQSILTNLVVGFRANTSARISGTSGTAQAIGYYQLTTAYQTILDGANSGTGAYTVNDFFVQAKALSITGSNGAKGSVIYFKVILTDEQTNAWSDVVAAGTNAVVNHLRATSGGVSIAAPTFAVVTNF